MISPGCITTSIWPLLPQAASTGLGIAFSGILSLQTSHCWLQQAMRAAPNAKVRLRPARSFGFLPGPPGSFETCITSLYQRPLASLNVLASHPPFRPPFNLLYLLSSPLPLVPFRGSYSRAFLSLAYRFSVCPCVQWSAKYHLLRVCLTGFCSSPDSLHLFELPYLSP